MLNQANQSSKPCLTKQTALILKGMLNQGDSTVTYKLKPEYKKMLETYPSFEVEVNLQKGGVKVEGEFILVHNIVTGHNDRLWICPSMFATDYKYKAKDKLISLMCADADFNNTFQNLCTAQWDDPSCYVCITYQLTDLDREMDCGSKIHIYKGDIERIPV